MQIRLLIVMLGLAGLLGLALVADVSSAQADKPVQAKAKDAEKREVDLKVLADPAHEKMNLKAPDTYEVRFKTTAGEFTIVVMRKWAPIGADRFYSLVKNGYYDGNRFFRVVPGFVVQWGLHGDKSVNKAWYDPKNKKAVNIKDDPVKQSNTKGRIVFATSGKDSRTTQLFINFGNNARLDAMGFAPFGEVKGGGMKVVEKLYDGYGEPPGAIQSAIVERGNKVLDDFFPKLDSIITATVIEKDAEKDDKQGAKEDKGE